MKEKVCFKTDTILLSTVLVLIATGFAGYLIYRYVVSVKSKVIVKTKEIMVRTPEQPQRFLRETLNRPVNVDFPGYNPGFSGKRVGYLYNGSGRFPLFEQRENRDYFYYVLDDSRNGVKIDVLKKRRDIITESDQLVVPELGGALSIKLYDTDFSYNSENY